MRLDADASHGRELLRDPETELIDRSDWVTVSEAKAAVFECIEVFYNGSVATAASETSVRRDSRSAIVRLRPSRPDEASPSTKPGQLQPEEMRCEQ
jgi:hypothetical protein